MDENKADLEDLYSILVSIHDTLLTMAQVQRENHQKLDDRLGYIEGALIALEK